MFEVIAVDQIDNERILVELDSPNKADKLARLLVEYGFTHKAWVEET